MQTFTNFMFTETYVMATDFGSVRAMGAPARKRARTVPDRGLE
jgi:hypothetical protein